MNESPDAKLERLRQSRKAGDQDFFAAHARYLESRDPADALLRSVSSHYPSEQMSLARWAAHGFVNVPQAAILAEIALLNLGNPHMDHPFVEAFMSAAVSAEPVPCRHLCVHRCDPAHPERSPLHSRRWRPHCRLRWMPVGLCAPYCSIRFIRAPLSRRVDSGTSWLQCGPHHHRLGLLWRTGKPSGPIRVRSAVSHLENRGGNYPAFHQVIPRDANHLAVIPHVRRPGLIAWLRSLSKDQASVQLDWSKRGQLTLTHRDANGHSATMQVPVEVHGNPPAVASNARYLADALECRGSRGGSKHSRSASRMA